MLRKFALLLTVCLFAGTSPSCKNDDDPILETDHVADLSVVEIHAGTLKIHGSVAHSPLGVDYIEKQFNGSTLRVRVHLAPLKSGVDGTLNFTADTAGIDVIEFGNQGNVIWKRASD